jgi:type II secretory ATPase GspE/PulE/Tfp pilus assembly ATPase PilB-like protein
VSGKSERRRLGRILIDRGVIDEEALARALAEQQGLSFWEPCAADSRLVLDLPQDLARGWPALPFRRDPNGDLHVAVADPTDPELRSGLDALLGPSITLYVAAPEQLLAALEVAYAGTTEASPQVEPAPLPAAPFDPSPIPPEIEADLALLLDDGEPAGSSVTIEAGDRASDLSIVFDAAATTLPTEGIAAERLPSSGPAMDAPLSQPAGRAAALADLAPSLGRSRTSSPPRPRRSPSVELVAAEGTGAELATLLATLSEDAPGGAFDALAAALVARAITWRANVIEFITSESTVRLRYRVDGSWQGVLMLPLWAGVGLFAALNRHVGAEGRPTAQERVGRLPVRSGEHSIELLQRSQVRGERERRTLRVLDPRVLPRTDTLGIPKDVARRVRQWTAAREGIVLVASPADSGRSTTLYAIAHDLARGRRTVVIDRYAAFSLADATVIARDEEGPRDLTAALALARSSELRCLVVDGVSGGSDLAAMLALASRGVLIVLGVPGNDAFEALSHLRQRGVSDSLLGEQLLGVVEQRLLRLLCPHCAEREPLDPALAHALGLVVETMPPTVPVAGAGCAACRHSGFQGRHPIFTRVELAAGVPLGCDEEDLRTLVDSDRPRSAPSLAVPLLAQNRTSLREIGRVVGMRSAAAARQSAPHVSVASPGWDPGVTGDDTMAGVPGPGEESLSLDGIPHGSGGRDDDERFRILVLETQDRVGPLLAAELPPGEYRIVVGDDLAQSQVLAREEGPAAIVLGPTERDDALTWVQSLRAIDECTFVPMVVVVDGNPADPMDLLLAGADEVLDAGLDERIVATLRAALHGVG